MNVKQAYAAADAYAAGLAVAWVESTGNTETAFSLRGDKFILCLNNAKIGISSVEVIGGELVISAEAFQIIIPVAGVERWPRLWRRSPAAKTLRLWFCA